METSRSYSYIINSPSLFHWNQSVSRANRYETPRHVIRWGDCSSQNGENRSCVSAVQCNSIYQSLITAGTETGRIILFPHEDLNRVSEARCLRSERLCTSGGNPAHKSRVSSLLFIEEHVLVSSSSDGFVRAWDCTRSNVVVELVGIDTREEITALVSTGNSGVLLTGSKGGAIRLRDLRIRDGEGVKTLNAGKTAITCLAADNSSTSLASGDSTGCVEVRDLRSLRKAPMLTLNGSDSACESQQARLVENLSPLIREEKKAEITEEMWGVAMGHVPTDRKRKTKRTAVSQERFPVGQEKGSAISKEAHSGSILSIFFETPSSILTVGIHDKCIKRFCGITGNLLIRTVELRDAPLCCTLMGDILQVGDRWGIEIFEKRSKSKSFSKLNDELPNPHAGSVTAMCQSGEWGMCTGGNDSHVFLHSFLPP